ncbi:hypothetical protein BaRGS_00039535 [Batillaria attramentaria]|uniref:Uncharacterized protein n=1 Tax=Batillaria attramentaria TaxID=370345 RepID=A0ABD0J3I3_9CAEN
MFTCTTLVDGLQKRAEQSGNKPAFIFRDKYGGRCVLPWQQIYRLGGRWAAVLKTGSVGRGHLVLNTLPNSPERVIVETGILLSGAASVNGQCQLADGSDLLHGLHVSRARAIVLDPDVPNSPWKVLEKLVNLDEDGSVTSEELPHLKLVYFVRRGEKGDDEDFLTHLENLSDWYQADVKPDDVMAVFTTSGSTGFSKLVVHTHDRWVNINLSSADMMDASHDHVDLALAPLGWIGGYPGFTILSGYPRVLCDVRGGGLPKDVPDFLWKCVQEERCTRVFILPVFLSRVAELARQRRQEGARAETVFTSTYTEEAEGSLDMTKWSWVPEICFLGGMPITRSMVKTAKSLAKNVVVLYGATDFSVISSHVVHDPDTFVDHDAGLVVKEAQVKIVDTEDENVILPVGQVGNILAKRPGMMREYLNNPQATADAFTADGFFRTGDVGSLDARGHLIVAGRGSDAIMRGPYIFYPGWLEARIRACPGVSDVLVVGVPDPFLHEELCACVVLTSDHVTTQHVREFVERDIVTTEDDPLSPRPRYYLRFESFPMTDTDKPRRKVVKKQAAVRLGVN